MISVVSPVYNSQNCINLLVKKISYTIKKITKNYEIVLVDDFSEDNSWKIIKKIKKKVKLIKGIQLKRNFGQHIAIFEGIKKTKYDIVIILDCDLQDNPTYILDLYKKHKKTNTPTIIKHSYKNFSYKKRIISNIFWIFLSLISIKKFNPNLGNFLLINKVTKKKYLKIQSIGCLYGDLISIGTKFIEINKKRQISKRGKTTYNLKKLLILAFRLIIKYNILRKLFFERKKNNLNNRIKKII
jgi:glycosyltransferase involved in cell wall biosynthesis